MPWGCNAQIRGKGIEMSLVKPEGVDCHTCSYQHCTDVRLALSRRVELGGGGGAGGRNGWWWGVQGSHTGYRGRGVLSGAWGA